jgi:flagellar protein FlaG
MRGVVSFPAERRTTMDGKIPEIKPMVLEPWVVPDNIAKQPDLVKPVPKDEGATFRKLSKESNRGQKEKSASLKPNQAKELTEEIQRYLSEMNLSINFEIYDKTGELVVKVINLETMQVIRQIPPKDLLRLPERLEELRGVLFAGKA